MSDLLSHLGFGPGYGLPSRGTAYREVIVLLKIHNLYSHAVGPES